MKRRFAKLIAEAAEDLGGDISVYEEYSGRGMYGDTTTGLVYSDRGMLLAAVSQVARDLDDDEFYEFQREMNSADTDSMGRDFIIY